MKKKIDIIIYSVLLAIVLTTGVCCGAMVDEQEAVKTLNDAGYKDVRVVESHYVQPSWFGCSREDDVAFECKATSPAGERITVTVCSNLLFKGSTIRH